MTRGFKGGSFSKDDDDSNYGAISDHLRNHVHLTNCIHLKNHMHRHSPILTERSLVKDLILLQRSRSLRDPSNSPPSWLSPSIIDALAKKHPPKDCSVHSGRRSIGNDHRKDIGRLSTSLPRPLGFASSKIAAAEASSDHHNVENGENYAEGSRNNHKNSASRGSGASPEESLAQNLEGRDKRVSKKSTSGNNVRLKTLSEQLEEVPRQTDSENGKQSSIHRHTREEKITEGIGASSHDRINGLNSTNRVKKRRIKSTRRARSTVDPRGVVRRFQNSPCVASNSYGQGSIHHKFHAREEESELEVNRAPGNGCGIPWNWSRIHHRGKTFLDVAGRSLSCGLSDSRLRKEEGTIPQTRGDVPNMVLTADHLSSSTNSDSESLPLLVEPSGSREGTENPFLVHHYSGELGIYANHGARHEHDSDLASEARSGNKNKSRIRHGRHRSLTQKYMPKTFKDLVGQNLAVQALSNAVLRRRVGLVYIFYGPNGTGKTSCARVFAKALNCQSLEHPKPCNVCNSCISHNLGKSPNVLELGPVGKFDLEGVLDILDGMMVSQVPTQYRVLIVDDCNTLSSDCWSAISKVIDQAPRHVVFVLISSNLDHLPHTIISRCQKFFFPKLRDSDIILMLQRISAGEGLEIDKDALKLIASHSDGSLRDAEMTLDQLSLLGQRISLPLVQELVGMVADEKLIDLLDLALSGDNVNTVKNLREIMETGVEPLALMSQLATIITDILAGSYVFTRERVRRRFFRRTTLSKDEMEKMLQALKTLSEAEKQLRVSNDKLTWLTAALLQLAPGQQPYSSTDGSFNHSPTVLHSTIPKGTSRFFVNEDIGTLVSDRGLSRGIQPQERSSRGANDVMHGTGKEIYNSYKKQKNNEKIWLAVLESIQWDPLKQFLYREGKLNSVIVGDAPTVELLFNSHESKSKAEKFREHILLAFESVLCSSLTLEIRYEPRKDARINAQVPPVLSAAENGSHHMTVIRNSMRNSKECAVKETGLIQNRMMHSGSLEGSKGEIVETVASPQDSRKNEEQIRKQSLVRSRVSLARVIQQAEGVSQQSVWSRRKAMSIAEKLEQENLRLEPRSRSLLCWKASKIARKKLLHLRIRTRKPPSLLKLVTCGRCVCTRSPR